MKMDTMLKDGIDGVALEVTKGTPCYSDIEKEFGELDKDKNGSVSFGEFCEYAITKIGTAEMFSEEIKDEEDDDDEDESALYMEEALNGFNLKPADKSKTKTIPNFSSAFEAVLAAEIQEALISTQEVIDEFHLLNKQDYHGADIAAAAPAEETPVAVPPVAVAVAE